jgi:hypothetical protein
MSIKINIKADVRGVQMMLDKAAKKAIPAAETRTVNALAFDVMRAERAATKEVFKNPSPFTQRAFLVDQAKPGGEPTARVFTNPRAEKYLEPYEFGGNQVSPGRATLDPVDAKVNGYGQLPKGFMQRLEGRKDIFIGTIKGITGVWQRVNVTKSGIAKRVKQRGNAYHPELGQIKLLILFGKQLPVKKQLGFEQRARALVEARFMRTFGSALARELK